MKVTLLVLISGLTFFSLIGYMLYILMKPKPADKNYWYSRSVNPAEKDVQEKISADNQKFEKFKELIRATVTCRNLVQKLAVETSNSSNKDHSGDLFTILEAGLLEDLEKKIVNIEGTLTDFRKNRSEALPDSLFLFAEELSSILIDNLKIIKDLKNPGTAGEEVYSKVEKYHSRIGEMHREIISLFQAEFNKTMEE